MQLANEQKEALARHLVAVMEFIQPGTEIEFVMDIAPAVLTPGSERFVRSHVLRVYRPQAGLALRTQIHMNVGGGNGHDSPVRGD